MARTSTLLALLLSVAGSAFTGGCNEPGGKTATTTSTLEAAARDLLGQDAELVSLAGPGMCPGHFDIRPSQVRKLRGCELVLRMDFQGSLDEKIGDAPRIVPVKVTAGLAVPKTYLSICRQVADALVEAGQIGRQEASRRLQAIASRVNRLGVHSKKQIGASGLGSRPVIASRHQADFCRYLGMEVVATLPGGEEASVRSLGEVIRLGRREKVGWIIANRPEGTMAADAIAKALGAGVVVLENFPEASQPESFDLMLQTNVTRIVTAAGTAGGS